MASSARTVCTVGSRRPGGEPLLDPLRVVHRLLGQHPQPLVPDVGVTRGGQQGGGRLPLTPAGGLQRVGQVDVVPDWVHGDDLVAPQLALDGGPARRPAR